MHKEKKIKNIEEDKKHIYIIVAVLVAFLLTILGTTAYTSFKKIECRNCVRSMILMEEGMLQMQKEFRFDVPPDIEFEELAHMMAYYYHFGPGVFTNPTTGTLVLRPKEEFSQLAIVERKGRYILDIPQCPSKGTYKLIPSETHPGLFEIECSKHGRVFMPDKDHKVAFKGKFESLSPKKTVMGREADLYFLEKEMPNDIVTVIPWGEAPPEEPASDEEKEPEAN